MATKTSTGAPADTPPRLEQPSAHVLVVDADAAVVEVVADALRREAFGVDTAGSAEEALELLAETPFDLVTLEVALPGRAGFDALRAMRASTHVPIVVVTSLAAELDRVLGLELGADDYVTKPFSTLELVSRIRAHLRRRDLDRAPPPATVHEVGGLRIDLTRHEASVDGRPVSITRAQFKTLTLLAREPGRVFTRRQIMHHLWEHGGAAADPQHACDVHISSLRRVVERDPAAPARIVTVRGVGYKLRP